jgi:hypothetical protein
MKKLFSSLLLIATIASCKKEETPVVEKTYSVEYKIELTPSPNTTLSGTASYISKASATSSAVLASPGWTVTETAWALKAGDKIGFTANVTNVGSYKAYIIVDGGIKTFESLTQSLPYNGPIKLDYIVE